MSSLLLDKDNLDRKPHNITDDVWYYEDKKGIDLYVYGKSYMIPVRQLRSYLRRLDARKRRTAPRPAARRKAGR